MEIKESYEVQYENYIKNPYSPPEPRESIPETESAHFDEIISQERVKQNTAMAGTPKSPAIKQAIGKAHRPKTAGVKRRDEIKDKNLMNQILIEIEI